MPTPQLCAIVSLIWQCRHKTDKLPDPAGSLSTISLHNSSLQEVVRSRTYVAIWVCSWRKGVSSSRRPSVSSPNGALTRLSDQVWSADQLCYDIIQGPLVSRTMTDEDEKQVSRQEAISTFKMASLRRDQVIHVSYFYRKRCNYWRTLALGEPRSSKTVWLLYAHTHSQKINTPPCHGSWNRPLKRSYRSAHTKTLNTRLNTRLTHWRIGQKVQR